MDRRTPVVEIYVKAFCPYCWRAEHLLDSKGVAYRTISIDFNGEERKRMIQRAQRPDHRPANLH